MITIFDYFGYNIPYEECYKIIKESGFDGVLLYWSDEFGNLNYKSNVQLALNSGLFIENMHTSFNDINDFWLDTPSVFKNLEYLLQCINDCNIYEIPTMVVHLTSGFNPPKPNKLGLDRLKKLVEKAEQKNVNIALENLKTIEHLDYVFNNIDSRRLGVCFDSGHQNAYTKNVDLLSKYGDKIIALHLHDNDGKTDQHLIPFDGNINWDVLTNKLINIEYSGCTSLEVTNNMGYENMSPIEFLQIAYKRAIKITR